MENSGPIRVMQVCSARSIIYGAVHSMVTLSDGLKNAGNLVEFLTFTGRGAGPELRARGESVHDVRVRCKVDPISITRMAKVYRRRKVQVVHTHLSTSSVNGALAARLAKIPSVASVHGMSGRFSFMFADRLIAVSEQVKRHLVSQGVDAKKIDVVYNGVDLAGKDLSRGLAVREELGITDRFPVIGTVSRVTAMKGISTSIEAINLLREKFPNLAYIVVGDGDGIAAARQQVQALGLDRHVWFTGYQRDIVPYLSSFDLFAFPSLKEAMGIALVEAGACGLPSVASNIDGIPEVVSPDTGILFPPQDAASMAEALDKLSHDDGLRASMGKAAQDRARQLFGVNAMVTRTTRVYERLIQEAALPAAAKESTTTTHPL